MKPKSKATESSTGESASLSHQVQTLLAENERMLTEFSDMQRHFGGLARSVWRIQEAERRRLARELHDGIGQSLTALQHRLETVPECRERDDAMELLTQTLEDVRELSRLLRPPVLDDLGLPTALQWLCRRVRESSSLRIEPQTDAIDGLELDDDLETLIFRVAQEALHNCVRHSEATRVTINTRRNGNRLELEIHDDGRGFDPDALKANPERAGVGLAGMRDRVMLFNGDLAIRSRPGRGTRITIGLPLHLKAGKESR